jgi:hypothetical protein
MVLASILASVSGNVLASILGNVLSSVLGNVLEYKPKRRRSRTRVF